MERTLLQEKYPIFVAEIGKAESGHTTMETLVDYYKARIAETPKVQFIGVFDHYAHTKRIGGPIADGIDAAVDIVFCFGHAIPDPRMLAVRPRAIGIADMGDRFVVSFMEAPMQIANDAMKTWTQALCAG